MEEKQVETFKQYLGRRFDRLVLPVLISLVVMILEPLAGIIMLFVIVLAIIVLYFPFRKEIDTVEPKKEEEIYVYKEYYNRAMVLRTIQALFLTAIIAMTFTSEDFILVIAILIAMIILGAIFMYLSPKTITVETFSSKDIKDVFWLNRHTLEICKSELHNKVLFLTYWVFIGFFGLFMSLTFLVDDQYRLLAHFVFLLFALSLLMELIFTPTYGFEDYIPKTVEDHLANVEPSKYGLEKELKW